MEPLEGYTFEGYRNPDGSVGTRNILAITTTVQCVSGVVDFAVQRIKANCCRSIPTSTTWWAGAHLRLRRGDRCAGRQHPDPHHAQYRAESQLRRQAMVVSLGCEKLQPTRLFPKGSIPIQNAGGADPGLVCLQDAQHVGFMSMIDSIMKQAETNLAELNKRQRETVPASELVVGVQCGGSDAFSGVTANPAVGFATDLLVRAGATVMFSEVTEVRDGIDQLTSRATTPEVAEAMIREMDWYDNYLKRGGVTAAPTPRRATRRAACPTSSRRRWARSSSRAARRFRACCRRATS
jgi:galactarate dehydratase